MKTKDSTIMFAVSAVIALAAFIILVASVYSKMFYEKRINNLMNGSSNQLTEAYILLLDPSPFAGYTNIDGSSILTSTLSVLNTHYALNSQIDEKYIEDVKTLLGYRMMGTTLGLRSSVYFFLISAALSIAGLISRKKENSLKQNDR
ncbi:MAG: hypothetical protein JXK07_09040 [Spirochaetes bacterium]|nr:hypothetical protein [Spirochaetota bacterium]MBN2770789.1 hypothetical protein [Spirochaetota bacterium]